MSLELTFQTSLSIPWIHFHFCFRLHCRAETLNVFDMWHMAYHGTVLGAVRKILDSGMLLLPGKIIKVSFNSLMHRYIFIKAKKENVFKPCFSQSFSKAPPVELHTKRKLNNHSKQRGRFIWEFLSYDWLWKSNLMCFCWSLMTALCTKVLITISMRFYKYPGHWSVTSFSAPRGVDIPRLLWCSKGFFIHNINLYPRRYHIIFASNLLC